MYCKTIFINYFVKKNSDDIEIISWYFFMISSSVYSQNTILSNDYRTVTNCRLYYLKEMIHFWIYGTRGGEIADAIYPNLDHDRDMLLFATLRYDGFFDQNSHTTQNGQNKWTKILTLETTIFGLKMMVKNGLFFILKSYVPLQRYLLTCQANSAILGRFFCTGQQQL